MIIVEKKFLYSKSQVCVLEVKVSLSLSSHAHREVFVSYFYICISRSSTYFLSISTFLSRIHATGFNLRRYVRGSGLFGRCARTNKRQHDHTHLYNTIQYTYTYITNIDVFTPPHILLRFIPLALSASHYTSNNSSSTGSRWLPRKAGGIITYS